MYSDIEKATKNEISQFNSITELGKLADKKLESLENAKRNQIQKEQIKYEKQLYNRLLKKYSAGTLSWNESHMLAELKKQDANGELEPNTDMNYRDMEKLQEKLLQEVNDLTTKLRGFGIQVSPLSGDFSLEAILQKLNEMREQAKAKVRPAEELDTEPEPDEEDKVEKSDTLICKLQLEESIPGVGSKGDTMRIYKDGWQIS